MQPQGGQTSALQQAAQAAQQRQQIQSMPGQSTPGQQTGMVQPQPPFPSQGQQQGQQPNQMQQSFAQFMQNPQVQSGIQQIGNFLNAISHPLAGAFSQLHPNQPSQQPGQQQGQFQSQPPAQQPPSAGGQINSLGLGIPQQAMGGYR